jgi:chitodextrinase
MISLKKNTFNKHCTTIVLASLFVLFTNVSAEDLNTSEFETDAIKTEGFCATPEPTHFWQQKQAKQTAAKATIKTTSSILYAPFKFKGESNPSVTDMEAVKEFFLRNSYGIYTLNVTFAPVIELPFTRAEDSGVFFSEWRNKLTEELTKLEFKPSDYDYYIRRTHSGKPFISGSTLGSATQGRIDLSTNDASVASHEMGHSLYYSTGFYGGDLSHANLWVANNGQVIGPGVSIKYGGKFSIMRSGTNKLHLDLGLPHKINMEWIKSNEYHSIDQNGTYRIYAHDRGVKQSGRKYGIKINKLVSPLKSNESQHYFIEYKSNTGYVEANNGVIMTVLDSDYHTQLLDNTPGSSRGAKDAPLAVGKTFRDNTAGITVKTLAKSGSGDDAWMDVKITFDDPNTSDTQAPSAPSDLKADIANITQTSIKLNWSASTDNVAVTEYEVLYNGKTVTVTGTSVTLSNLTPNVNYSIKVRAKDGAGNLSEYSQPETAVTDASPTLSADAGKDKVLNCKDSYVILGKGTMISGATYRWTTADGHIQSGANRINAEVDKAGTYTLTVSKADSETVSDSVVITAEENCDTATLPDNDNDGIPDNEDNDDDNDNVIDSLDAFPFDSSESVDTDSDGVGNNADLDDDNDGVSDAEEKAAGTDPLDATDKPNSPIDEEESEKSSGGNFPVGLVILGLLALVRRKKLITHARRAK